MLVAGRNFDVLLRVLFSVSWFYPKDIVGSFLTQRGARAAIVVDVIFFLLFSSDFC